MTRHLLHVGCGTAPHDRLPALFRCEAWTEVRFDIDPSVRPDIVGDMTDLSALADGSFDAIWSSHNLEHLNGFEVPLALREFRRVLRPDGFALITVPDLQAVAFHVVQGDLHRPLYESAAGPISALDILFGHQDSIAAGQHHMAHRTGFDAHALGQALTEAGFAEARVHRGRFWDLWAVATLPDTPTGTFAALADLTR